MNALSFATAIVELMQLDDLPQVIEIERQSNSHPWTERNFQDAIASGYLCLVARERGRVCAFAIARLLLDEAELLLIAVTPAERRQGVAALLWIDLSLRLRALGAQLVHLEVRAGNEIAQLFYVSLGFASTGMRKSYYPNGVHGGDREDAVLMQVKL